MDIAGSSISKRHFGRCALVGAAAYLRGSNLGSKIDGQNFDTVIRVNRVPHPDSPEDARDMGTRTDILFGGAVADDAELWHRHAYDVHAVEHEGLDRIIKCRYDGSAGCPVGGVVLNNGVVGSEGHFEELYPRFEPGWKPESSVLPMARQADAPYHAVQEMKASRILLASQPTSGFHAIMTFLPVCDTVTLFGFRGDGTADGHPIPRSRHNIKREHQIIEKLLRGQVPSSIAPYIPAAEKGPTLRKLEVCLRQRLATRRGRLGRFHEDVGAF